MAVQGSSSIQNFRNETANVALALAAIATVALITAVAFRHLKVSASGSEYHVSTSDYGWGHYTSEYAQKWAQVTRTNAIWELSSRFALWAGMLSATAAAANFMSYHPAIENRFVAKEVA